MTRGSTRQGATPAIPGDEFRRLGHELVDRVADILESLPQRRVTTGQSPAQIRELLGAEQRLPEHGESPAVLLAEATSLLEEHSLYNGHPRFLGYITSSPAPIGILADFLASAINQNVGSFTLSPVATEIELQTIRWIAEMLGFPTDCGGVLVSGGNMANMVCLMAARAAGAGWDVRAEGMNRGPGSRLAVYCSAETHTWIQKGTDITGLGTSAIRWITADAGGRMDVAALREAISRDRTMGITPLLVVGTAGSVSTGAIDPLAEIAALCRESGIWFHVDGAYGAFAAALPEYSEALAAMADADSVAVDPHKWLYAPLEAGCALVRNAEALRAAFSYHPPYYHFGVVARNLVDYGPQNSRGFRALKVWLALRQMGRAGYVESIREDIRLARVLHDALAAHSEFEVMTNALSITTFRYVPAALRGRAGDAEAEVYLERLNRSIIAVLEASGEAFVSQAVIGGRFALRACVVNFNTAEEDVTALPDVIARFGREQHAALRREDPLFLAEVLGDADRDDV
jgi:aromatic-L-amino-acid/L-tryptophan decarboxylase